MTLPEPIRLNGRRISEECMAEGAEGGDSDIIWSTSASSPCRDREQLLKPCCRRWPCRHSNSAPPECVIKVIACAISCSTLRWIKPALSSTQPAIQYRSGVAFPDVYFTNIYLLPWLRISGAMPSLWIFFGLCLINLLKTTGYVMH